MNQFTDNNIWCRDQGDTPMEQETSDDVAAKKAVGVSKEFKGHWSEEIPANETDRHHLEEQELSDLVESDVRNILAGVPN